jgi:tetratricopeptide (TPR) repeat protein
MASARLSCLFDLGSWDQVLEAASSITDGPQDSGLYGLSHSREYHSRVTALRGDAEGAPRSTEREVEIARDSGSIEFSVGALAFAAIVRLGAGDPRGASEALSELERTPHRGEAGNYAPLLPGMVRTAVAAGDIALAERLARGFEPIHRYQEHALCAARAMLAEGRGEAEEAARLYGEAATRWEGFGVVPERGLALLGEGRCLLALGRPIEAVEALRWAREVFSGLGAKPSLSETDALLEEATALIA